jgi:hypothetical protein
LTISVPVPGFIGTFEIDSPFVGIQAPFDLGIGFTSLDEVRIELRGVAEATAEPPWISASLALNIFDPGVFVRNTSVLVDISAGTPFDIDVPFSSFSLSPGALGRPLADGQANLGLLLSARGDFSDATSVTIESAIVTVRGTPVPEPGLGWLTAAIVAALALRARRRRKGMVAFLVALIPLHANAQWVSLSEQTDQWIPAALRPGANPVDDKEKDLAVADIDLDGDDDIFVVRKLEYYQQGAEPDYLLLNTGTSFALATNWPSGNLTDARDVLMADFTADGFPDVVIATTFGQQPKFYRNLGNDGVGAWLGLADESARLPNLVSGTPTPLFCGVGAGDVNGDGGVDLYFAGYLGTSSTCTTGDEGVRDVLLINQCLPSNPTSTACTNGSAPRFTNETLARLGAFANTCFSIGEGCNRGQSAAV